MDNLQLKRYTILEKVGKGGMADVYLAYDNVLKRECAIKILLSELSNDAVAKLRFRREADAAAHLQHPNITTIYDIGEANNRPFIVMEYVHGQTLKELIIQRGSIEKKEAIFLMTQILEGIESAHKAGVIHRDVKPQNIIIKADGTAKVADFGIASKSVTINSKENRFSVMRFSPGLLLDRFFHIDDQKKFFVGAGIQYHFMSFENTPANGFGGRIESGLRFRTLEETNYSFFLMFDFANQKTPTTIASKIKSIDFSGLGIGARIEF